MLIAVTSSSKPTTHLVNKAYMDYVKQAGYEPLLVGPTNDPQIIATLCDGLVLTGGIDIDPIYYGEANAGSFNTNLERDNFERALLHAFITLSKPVFGICRGFQLIIREYMCAHPRIEEEKLFEYWQNFGEHSLADARNVARTQATHFVDAKMTQLYGIEGNINEITSIAVNSMHHQGLIGRLTKQTFPRLWELGVHPLAATTWGRPTNAKGAIVEAFLIPNWNGSKVKAVQWHPEELCQTYTREYSLITSLFVEQAESSEVEHG